MATEATLKQLQERAVAFRDAREWQRFHTPRNLAAALAIEAAELQESLLWLNDEEVALMLQDPQRRQAMEDEMADVMAYLLCLAEATGTDLAAAFAHKMARNEEKYPVELARGRADKYHRYRQTSKNE